MGTLCGINGLPVEVVGWAVIAYNSNGEDISSDCQVGRRMHTNHLGSRTDNLGGSPRHCTMSSMAPIR
jgi:hypothetical protein